MSAPDEAANPPHLAEVAAGGPKKEVYAADVDTVKKLNKAQDDWFWAWFWRDLARPLVLVAAAFTALYLCLEYDANYLLAVFCFCFGLTPCVPVLFWPMLVSLVMLVLHGWVFTTGLLSVIWGPPR